MDASTLWSAGAFVIGLAVTLVLAAHLTPRHWWRRPNARALLVLVAGTWGLGSLLLVLLPTVQPALAQPLAPPKAAPDHALSAGQPFLVHRDLNLRAAAGVDTSRLLTVPAGSVVTPTGVREGDWWQVRTQVGGRDTVGWVSSLWLRRNDE